MPGRPRRALVTGMAVRYVGDGPNCYADALTMVLGPAGPGPAAIEVLTGSPYGLSLHGPDLPIFCPSGWTPEIGIAAALDLLGWTCERTSGSVDEAVARIARATPTDPVVTGPLEMGLLPHHPSLGQAIGTEHYFVVLGLEGDVVRMHDPRGFPYATLPLDSLLAAWQTDAFVYPVEPFITRSRFRRVREVDLATALRDSLPAAVRWLVGPDAASTAERIARIVEDGLTDSQYKYLVEYTVSGGAGRLGDAAVLLAEIGCAGPARVLEHQARLVGALQHPLMAGDRAAAAALWRELAPTYPRLRDELSLVLREGPAVPVPF
ncbi:hypothetical protein [Salinispora arenicola]|uniref:hypothetical protein n=1 Tax=Salinispora arenicola TaxID=168697 RepID=UPI00037EA1C2|nr:hypothetical protein [Salinispora arenicola]